MPRFTNVENVLHKGLQIGGVLELAYTINNEALRSRTDGARADELIGDLGGKIRGLLIVEDDGRLYEDLLGNANSGTLSFNVQQDQNTLAFSVFSISNVRFESVEYTTAQDGVNKVRLRFETLSEDDSVSRA